MNPEGNNMESTMVASVIVILVSLIVGVILVGNGSGHNGPNFDYDYKLMQKLSELQTEQKVLNEQVFKQSKLIEELQKDLQDSASSQWGDWTSWSQCTVSCTGQDGGRLQTRDRTRSTSPSGTQSESETRPCNAVQFAGCVNQHGPDDNYAIAYDYADQLAISTCTALLTGADATVYSVRRKCSSTTVSCSEICNSNGMTCFNALHVYRPGALGRDDTEKPGLYMHRYNSCAGNFCGPNFCCCKK